MPLVRKPASTAPPSPSTNADPLTGLRSTNPDERWTAARAAVDVVGAAPALGAALRVETDARVREAIFTSLTRIGGADGASQLLPLLRSNDAALRTGALDALRLSVVATRVLLPALLRDPDVDVRILSCELARALPSEEATLQLCSLLTAEPEVNVCAAAIEVLAEVGSPEALPAIAQCGQRFPKAPFLSFAIQVATDRINAQTIHHRG